MSMEDMERVLELVREHEEANFVGPRGRRIAAAEKALGHPLPPTFRRFVEELGAGDLAGVEIYGIASEDFEGSGIPDAIWFTLEERREGDLPEGLVLVMQDIDGFFACLDTRGVARGAEAPVVAWRDGEPSERLASDFGAFVREQLEHALDPT